MTLQTRAQIAEANPCYLCRKIVYLERVASTGQIPALMAALREFLGLHECAFPEWKEYVRDNSVLPILKDRSATNVIDLVSRCLKKLNNWVFDDSCNRNIHTLELIEYIIRNDLEMECDLAPIINPLKRFAGLTTAQKLEESGLTFEYHRQLVREIERPGEDFDNTTPWTDIENLWRTVE
ncbi:unnamed protein product [Amoebophrya sp. A120]|nr:unnamed protein product [Amoebophrya sp. A120]|eukprot:GSA120T00001716001.1